MIKMKTRGKRFLTVEALGLAFQNCREQPRKAKWGSVGEHSRMTWAPLSTQSKTEDPANRSGKISHLVRKETGESPEKPGTERETPRQASKGADEALERRR